MLFDKDDMHKKLDVLSGGEAARLLLARLGAEAPDPVLDEPTNHLDLEGIQSLAEGLLEYEGTIIFVSHDRWFVDKVASRILEITPDGIEDFPGTYAEYLAKSAGSDHLDLEAVAEQEREKKREQKRQKRREKEAERKAAKKAVGKPTLPSKPRRKSQSFTCLRPINATCECLDALAHQVHNEVHFFGGDGKVGRESRVFAAVNDAQTAFTKPSFDAIKAHHFDARVQLSTKEQSRSLHLGDQARELFHEAFQFDQKFFPSFLDVLAQGRCEARQHRATHLQRTRVCGHGVSVDATHIQATGPLVASKHAQRVLASVQVF